MILRCKHLKISLELLTAPSCIRRQSESVLVDLHGSQPLATGLLVMKPSNTDCEA